MRYNIYSRADDQVYKVDEFCSIERIIYLDVMSTMGLDTLRLV